MSHWKKCPLCGATGILWSEGEELVRLDDGTTRRFAAAPHHHCDKCGENFYDYDAAEKILTRSRNKAA